MFNLYLIVTIAYLFFRKREEEEEEEDKKALEKNIALGYITQSRKVIIVASAGSWSDQNCSYQGSPLRNNLSHHNEDHDAEEAHEEQGNDGRYDGRRRRRRVDGRWGRQQRQWR